jgi:hypothetical protein
MAKRKSKKRRHAAANDAGSRPTLRASSRPLTVSLGVPLHWTPEAALAVFDLIDDLRDKILAVYQFDIQQLTYQQYISAPNNPIHIDDDDLPF